MGKKAWSCVFAQKNSIPLNQAFDLIESNDDEIETFKKIN